MFRSPPAARDERVSFGPAELAWTAVLGLSLAAHIWYMAVRPGPIDDAATAPPAHTTEVTRAHDLPQP
jgi:hypothetical protein